MAASDQCHYCGADLGGRDRGSYDRLRGHLTAECEAVPERVRRAHERGCATGACDR